MIKVCIHYPLNPDSSMRCMGLIGHDAADISELEIPFSGDLRKFDLVLAKLGSSGLIDRNDARRIYEEVEREREKQRVIADEGLRFIPVDKLISTQKIAEINIKYRD